MNRSWFVYYGRKLNMSRREVMSTPYGEMMDMIACLAIDENGAKQKQKKKKLSYDEIMALK